MLQVGTKNAYQYNGKELNEDLGLNLSDYGARWYDAAIARFTTIDPMAEAQHTFGTYSYAANNPMRFIDYMGLAASDPEGVRKERAGKREERDAQEDVEATAGEIGKALSSAQEGDIVNLTGRNAQDYYSGLEEGGFNNLIPVFQVKKSKWEDVYWHTIIAQGEGHPRLLTYDSDKDNQKIRRDEAMIPYPLTSPLFDRDEYPYASTFEGGLGSSVMYVRYGHNRSHGSALGKFYAKNKMTTGSKFFVFPENDKPNRTPQLVPVPVTVPVTPIIAPRGLMDQLYKSLQRIPSPVMPLLNFPIFYYENNSSSNQNRA